MTDLIEVLARAICLQASLDDGFDAASTTHSIELGMWRNHAKQAGACLAALDAAGYQIVPKEPTLAQIEIGIEMLCGLRELSLADEAKEIYRAMLAAAPKAPARTPV